MIQWMVLKEVRETVTLLGKRINIWYMHGNRDFLVTEKFVKALSINLLEDPTILEVKKKYYYYTAIPYVQMTKNIKNFRNMVRSSAWQKEMLSKSLDERLAIANSLRKQSIEANKEKE